MNNDVSFDALQKELAEVGVAFTDINRIIATHGHGDHYGLSGRIKKLSKAKIIAHHLVRDSIKSMSKQRQERGRQMSEWLQLNGVPPFDESELRGRNPGKRPRFPRPATPDILLKGGETIVIGSFNLDVLWTPGHDPGQICLYEPTQKVLFSGDHVLPVTTPHVSVQNESNHNPLGDFLNSLNAVKELEADLVLPGHEDTFTNLQVRVVGLIRHHHQRDAEILEALEVEPKTAYQISYGITWMPTQGGIKFPDLTSWHQRMAVSETLAHLKAMDIKGEITKDTRDGVVYYQHTC
ncbi:MBL fold metallo-hydrolase, partial [Chloroflexota bacterium]